MSTLSQIFLALLTFAAAFFFAILTIDSFYAWTMRGYRTNLMKFARQRKDGLA